MPSVISTDVLIVGAGVAGLWLNARLRRQGFSTVLVESASLGGPDRSLGSHCRHAASLA
jgi:2-polyprenyl-6-methoxyphenol hydroxylase-like FAD-dependent oxidoreductase